MNENPQPQRPYNEEADLGILFSAIGRLFERLYRFILRVFRGIFHVVIWCSRAIIENARIIIIAMVLAGVGGYLMEKFLPAHYESNMIVRTYFDSKYQLYTNINYYNAVLAEGNHDALVPIFEVPVETLHEVVEFELLPGPESENQRIRAYDRFIKSIDSLRAQEISFDDYIDNRSLFGGSIFNIRVETKSKDIFKDLEIGIGKSFENLYSIDRKRKRDSLITLKRNNILTTITEIDSLQNVYISVLEEEAEATRASINLTQGFPLQQEKTDTKEYQLLQEEIKLRDELRILDESLVQENEYYDVMSSFQQIGNKVRGIENRYSITLPALAFLLLALGYLAKNYIRYVRNYEA